MTIEHAGGSNAGWPDAIGLDVADGVATITLRRPEKRNALTAEMVRGLLRAVDEVGRHDDVKVIVVRGEGPDFCAGFDVTDPTEFEGRPDEPRRSRIASIREKAEWMRALLESVKPLIISVQGNCVGIGMYFVLVADFAIVSDDAALGLPEERFGSAGATWSYPYLIREVGLKRANEIVMTGRRFTAEEIYSFGLVNRVVPKERLERCTTDLARSICTLPRDGIAINRAAKQLALSASGHIATFAVHAVAHPLAEHLRREPDELDFMALVERDGMRLAVEERNRRFAGDWWGW